MYSILSNADPGLSDKTMTQINTSAENNSIANSKIRFTPNTEFEKELKKRVSVYFEENSVSKKDNARMYLKTFIAVLWVAASYSLLVFAGLPVWGLILAAVSLERRAERALVQRDARRAPRGLFRAPVGEQADGTLPRPHRRELLFLVQEAQLLPSFLPQYRGARRRHRGGDLRAP